MITVYICPTCNAEHDNYDAAIDCHNAPAVTSEERMEPGEAEREEDLAIMNRLRALTHELDTLNRDMGALREKRGVPTDMSQRRVRKAREYISEARDYWKYDVIQGNGKQTADDKNRAANYELS